MDRSPASDARVEKVVRLGTLGILGSEEAKSCPEANRLKQLRPLCTTGSRCLLEYHRLAVVCLGETQFRMHFADNFLERGSHQRINFVDLWEDSEQLQGDCWSALLPRLATHTAS